MEVKAARSRRGSASFVKLTIPGTRGKAIGGKAPTLGIIGFLGGVGARPEVIGLVSDADGAVASLAAGLKLVDMYRVGDRLDGDVILCTHMSPNSPIIPHEPVPFMSSPVSMATMKRHMVDERMDAVLSLDTTKGNRIINTRGFAISPTVKEGYILRVSEDLLTVQQNVTGRVPSVFAITTQDVTPYGNRLFHLNSIMQPASATDAPAVGVAVTTEAVVPGCASGASHEVDIELAARFVVEVARGFGRKSVRFYDAAEFSRLVKLYGSMKHLQTLGNQEAGSGSTVRRRTRVRRGDE